MRGRRPAIFPARSGSTCSTSCANARSVEFETLGAHECAEVGPFRHRILPRLVFRPAIVGAFPEPVGVALRAEGLDGLPPAIVGDDLLLQPSLVIAVAVEGDIEAQPRAHHPLERRPTGAQRGYREDMLGQPENVGYLGGMVADGAD